MTRQVAFKLWIIIQFKSSIYSRNSWTNMKSAWPSQTNLNSLFSKKLFRQVQNSLVSQKLIIQENGLTTSLRFKIFMRNMSMPPKHLLCITTSERVFRHGRQQRFLSNQVAFNFTPRVPMFIKYVVWSFALVFWRSIVHVWSVNDCNCTSLPFTGFKIRFSQG